MMTALIMLDPELNDLVKGELESGEQARWVGRPRVLPFVRRLFLSSVFAIPFTAIGLLLVLAAANAEGGQFWLILVFGLVVLAPGLYHLSSPLWTIRKAQRTVYVVTDRRAIVFTGTFSRIVLSFGPEQFTQLLRTEKPDGSGDILFLGPRTAPGERRRRSGSTDSAFYGIENVKEVEGLLKDIAAQAPS